MNTNARPERTEELWRWVESEKQLDRRVHRISRIAWALTVAAVIVYGVVILARVGAVLSELARQNVPRGAALGVALDALVPLITVLGVFFFLVAVLSTIAVFLRFRTASLAEIRVRLSAMEEMLLKDPPRP
jgi:hypothetical protein